MFGINMLRIIDILKSNNRVKINDKMSFKKVEIMVISDIKMHYKMILIKNIGMVNIVYNTVLYM